MAQAYNIDQEVVYLVDDTSGDILKDTIISVAKSGSTYVYSFTNSENSVLERQIVGLSSATKATLKSNSATKINAQRDAVKATIDTQYAAYVTTSQTQIDAL